jgi:kynureninase
VVKALRADGVFVDSRGDLLRLGPAPYLTDEELDHGLARVVARVHGR